MERTDGIKGDTLIDIGTGPTIHQFLSACESFREKDMKGLLHVQEADGIKGDTLINIGTGPTIHQFLSACESFREIIATDYTDQNREEVQRWLKREPGSFDWTPIVKYVCELEGDREKWPEKEEKVRRVIKQYLKCDVTQPNPLAPLVLPPADCLLSTLCFDGACRDIPTYRTAFRNISSLLKPGGHLFFHSTLEGYYYMVGQCKFSALYLEKEVIEEAVRQAGFVIKWIEETRIHLPPSVADGKGLCILLAQKCSP
ncbi:nicotinamide N-methyltransferase-like [Protobothrops mucrosquamatus]|uniref:nicotinamide N-methyltransferase-like n=1 Tax=Protobothrops mucrosquamatus TaxID=103944 RepID=UPI0010FAE8FD|nr:nicotinamide N-methyltransferase-like [Protobothrops mucrosquamatus]